MIDIVFLVFRFLARFFRTRIGLQTEILALRHQLCVLQHGVKWPKIRPADRVLWSLLSDWKEALIFVKPDTVIRWQRRRFKEHWTKLCRRGEPGRPTISQEVGDRIRTLSKANPT